MLDESNAMDELNDFLDEQKTNPCGEGGCNSCHIAYHRSCDPILSVSEFDVNTEVDIRPVFHDDDEYAELGGEG